MDNGASSYRRFLEGDENGFIEIVRDYKDGLILYLNSFTNDLTTAEELTEEVFVRLGVKKPKDKGTASFKTWLYTIGRHLAIDHLRRRTRNRETSLELCGEISSDEKSLEASFLQEEQKIAVHRAMRDLPPEYRQVLWLIYFEGFSQKETAKIMQKNVHGIETLVYRARLALKSRLEKDDFSL